jgi:hypothetical protein
LGEKFDQEKNKISKSKYHSLMAIMKAEWIHIWSTLPPEEWHSSWKKTLIKYGGNDGD